MENIALMRVVQDHYVGHSKVFLDRQGHLGEVQPQRPQGVGQEQGLPQRMNFWKNGINRGCSRLFRMIIMATSRYLTDSQDHLGEVQPQRPQGVGQEQGLPQRVNFWKNCTNIGCSRLFRMIIMAISRCFQTSRTIWVESSPKDTKV